jgi:hypothetical protein
LKVHTSDIDLDSKISYNPNINTNCELGTGKNKLKLHIIDIMLIKSTYIKNIDTLYSLKIYIDNNHYELPSSSYNDFINKNIIINFKRSLFMIQP